MRVQTTANMGAYLSTFASCIPTILYATLLAGQYTTPAIHCEVTAAFTNTAPVDLNAWVPADSPWYLISPGGISAAGEIAVTAVNLQTFEIHAVVLSPVNGVGRAARGAIKPPVLPESVRRLLRSQVR